jgi:pyruvate formate lyase activating enzyme
MDTRPQSGLVLAIQHFCTDDGPGIRNTVFLKGCPNRCKWCCNPESINRKPELAYNIDKCIGKAACGRCLQAPVPQGATYTIDGPDDRIHINWDLADGCGEETVSVCPTGALYLFGREMTAEEVLAEVEQDSAFFDQSGGGVTLSGGECLLQPDFSAAILGGAHDRGFTTAIETAGNVPWAYMEKVLPHVDVMLHDHKLIDSDDHRQWVGVPNHRIRENYQRAYQYFPDIRFIARTPIVPGVNLTEEHVRGVLEFIRPYPNVVDYQLLPYHRYGEAKYGFLGRVYQLADFQPPSEDTMQQLRSIIDDAFGREVERRSS